MSPGKTRRTTRRRRRTSNPQTGVRTRWRQRCWTTCDAALAPGLPDQARLPPSLGGEQGQLGSPARPRGAGAAGGAPPWRARVPEQAAAGPGPACDLLLGAALRPLVRGDVAKGSALLCTAVSQPRDQQNRRRCCSLGRGLSLRGSVADRGVRSPARGHRWRGSMLALGSHPSGVAWQRPGPAGIDLVIKYIYYLHD